MSGIRHIGIIGEGKMGNNIFQFLSGHGFRLTWITSSEADTEKLERSFRKKLQRSFDAGILTEQERLFQMENTKVTKELDALRDCDLVIEAIPEELEIKRSLFRVIDGIVPTSCILASNSSSISPALLVPSEQRRDRMVGFHFFYPVALKNIVELVVLPQTAPSVVNALKGFLVTIGRNHLVLPEQGAFILNRIFLDVQNEAFRIVSEGGCDLRQMDRLARSTVSPAGIFEFFDSVGNDVMLSSVLNYSRIHPDPDRFKPLIRRLEDLVAAGHLGQKSGQGFYEHPLLPEEDNPALTDPGRDASIIERLQSAYRESLSRHAALTNYTPEEIGSVMEEYLGLS